MDEVVNVVAGIVRQNTLDDQMQQDNETSPTSPKKMMRWTIYRLEQASSWAQLAQWEKLEC